MRSGAIESFVIKYVRGLNEKDRDGLIEKMLEKDSTIISTELELDELHSNFLLDINRILEKLVEMKQKTKSIRENYLQAINGRYSYLITGLRQDYQIPSKELQEKRMQQKKSIAKDKKVGKTCSLDYITDEQMNFWYKIPNYLEKMNEHWNLICQEFIKDDKTEDGIAEMNESLQMIFRIELTVNKRLERARDYILHWHKIFDL